MRTTTKFYTWLVLVLLLGACSKNAPLSRKVTGGEDTISPIVEGPSEPTILCDFRLNSGTQVNLTGNAPVTEEFTLSVIRDGELVPYDMAFSSPPEGVLLQGVTPTLDSFDKTLSIRFTSAGTKSLTFSINVDGASTTCQEDVNVEALSPIAEPPVLQVTPENQTIAYGASGLLSWYIPGLSFAAVDCQILKDGAPYLQNISDPTVLLELTALHSPGQAERSINLTMNCTVIRPGEEPILLTDSVTVTLKAEPQLSLKLNGVESNLNLTTNTNYSVSWSSTGMDSCALYRNGVVRADTRSGSFPNIVPPTSPQTYLLSCNQTGGAPMTKEFTVTYTPPPAGGTGGSSTSVASVLSVQTPPSRAAYQSRVNLSFTKNSVAGNCRLVLQANVSGAWVSQLNTILSGTSYTTAPLLAGTYRYFVTCGTSSVFSSNFVVSEPVDNILFVTSSAYDGNLGGIAGANAICQSIGRGLRADRSWKAILSDSHHNAKDIISLPWMATNAAGKSVSRIVRTPSGVRIAYASGFWYARSGSLSIGAAWNHAANEDENGRVIGVPAWTGSTCDGRHTNRDCHNWTSNERSRRVRDKGYFGSSSALYSTRMAAGSTDCDTPKHLYCISQ